MKRSPKHAPLLLLVWTTATPAELPVVKLKPQVREIPLARVEPHLPYEALKPFLVDVYVTSAEAVKGAPYVVAFEDRRTVGGAGDLVYVRPPVPKGLGIDFALYRPAKPLHDPVTGELLGYRLLKVADLVYLREGDPTTFRIGAIGGEVRRGDILLPKIEPRGGDLKLRRPETAIEGRVLEVLTPAIASYGRYDLVLLNRGRRDGLRPGHLLKVWRQNFRVRDPVVSGWVQLPDEEAGELLVVESFERVSVAIVLDSRKPLSPFDRFSAR